MIDMSRPHLLARRAAYLHFAIAFFPTVATLSYLVTPGLPVMIGLCGLIAYCASMLWYGVLLCLALFRGQDKKYLAATMRWVVLAQGAFIAQSIIILAIIQRK
jgi:hypothetical protein